jgi:GNAT superfamily N-acetyltransferase
MSHSIRKIRADESDYIAPLFDEYRSYYGQTSDIGRARLWLRERVGLGEATVFVAERQGVPCGFTLLYPSWSSVATARTYILNDLFVAESVRRSGVGEALLDAAVEFARGAGAHRISLETGRSNHPARALYQHAGWVEDETQWFHRDLG